MKFTKMHGAGNDYIYLNCMDGQPADLPGLARRLSRRHFGVGGDGLICLCPSASGDFRMRMFNADGSEGQMCGNGIRCLAKFAYDLGLTCRRELDIETLAGMRRVELHLDGGVVTGATVDMGAPQVGRPIRVRAGEQVLSGIPVSMGNPHFVVESDGLDSLDLPGLGRGLERSDCFPDGVNAEFAQVRDSGSVAVRVWERGSGETLACGTGACAVAAALGTAGRVGRQVRVWLPGGVLEVEWSLSDGHMYMTGPTVTVYDGQFAD